MAEQSKGDAVGTNVTHAVELFEKRTLGGKRSCGGHGKLHQSDALLLQRHTCTCTACELLQSKIHARHANGSILCK